MSGIVNSAQERQINDPALNKIAQGVEAKVPPAQRHQFMATITSGLAIMFSPQTTHLLEQRLSAALQSAQQPQALGDVVARLMVLLQHESKGVLQADIAVPASVVLLCEMLDYAEKTDRLQVNPELIATASQTAVANTLKYFGIGPQQIVAARQAAQQGPTAVPGQGS